MQYHEWQTKYEKLLKAASLFAHHQRRYEEFRSEADRKKMRQHRTEVEDIVKGEHKNRDSKQGELL